MVPSTIQIWIRTTLEPHVPPAQRGLRGDSTLLPVQWHRTPTTQETDGFQVKRPGDLSVRCTLLLMLDYQVRARPPPPGRHTRPSTPDAPPLSEGRGTPFSSLPPPFPEACSQGAGTTRPTPTRSRAAWPRALSISSLIVTVTFSQPPQFKLDPRLARLLGLHTQSRSAIVQALWQYVKTNRLQDSHDKEYINGDKYFQQVA